MRTQLLSLSAAITAIGATKTTLLVDTDAVVSTALVIPATLQLKFINGAKFTKSGAGAITFQGPCITGDPTHQIFSGFASGDITFTGGYPMFRPEWFGAVGDDNGATGTDCLAAFNATFAAMATGYPVGGTVQLTDGRFYFLSGTLNVRRSVQFLGGAYNVGVPNTYLRFPANTPGIIFHGLSTFDGTITTQNSLGSEVRGIGINGAKGANNTVLSTNGLSFTLTGGTFTQASILGNGAGTIASLPPGSTITLNGFNYVTNIAIPGIIPSSVIPIQRPRFVAFSVGDGTIVSLLGVFPSNNDWAGSTIDLKNPFGATTASYTILSHTTTVITLLAGTPAVGVVEIELSGVKVMTGQNARLNIYHGIDVRSQIKITDCNVNGFAGNGIDCNSTREPTGIPGGEPNSNNSYFERTLSQENSGSGWNFYGANSNNIETHSINAENNKGYGVHEEGTSGCNHFGWHNSFNWHGAFRMVGAIAANMVWACYTEGQQPTSIADARTIVLGGNHGAGIRNNPGYLLNPSQVVRQIDEFNTTDAWLFGVGFPFNQNKTLMSFGVGEDLGNIANSGTKTLVTAPSYYLKYDNPKPGWYGLGWCSNAIGTIINNLIGFSGGVASEGGGQLAFPEGFRTGSGGVGAWIPDSKISRMLRGTVTVDPASINANITAVQTFTLTGAVVGDNLTLNVPAAGLTPGLVVNQVWVSATNTISISFTNTTGSPIDEGSASWSYLLIR